MPVRKSQRARQAVERVIQFEGNQVGVARRIRVSQAIVSKWLTGKTLITPARAVALEKAYPGVVTRAELRPDLWD